MDYAELLRRETHDAHAIFHQFALAVSTAQAGSLFFFFEGDEDPSFYMPHIAPRISGRSFHTLICYGRHQVLKANELVERDGRGTGRTLFFVDKDHTDIVAGAPNTVPRSVFQTCYYSIENYLTCEAVFRRFWVERLHLSDLDPRYPTYLSALNVLTANFVKKSRVLMSLVLIGRGIDGLTAVKLNLNNVQLDRIIQVDTVACVCRFKPGAMQHFLAGSNIGIGNPALSNQKIRDVFRKHLRSCDPNAYIRGKYALWFFWKVLTAFTRQLSDRASARAAGTKRATPSIPMGFDFAVESLAPLAPCPPDLADFLAESL